MVLGFQEGNFWAVLDLTHRWGHSYGHERRDAFAGDPGPAAR